MGELRIFDPFAIEPFEDSLRSLMRPWRFEAPEAAPRIKLDLAELDGSYTVKAEIPGVRKEDIDVRVEGNQVTISAVLKSEKEEEKGGRVLRRERQEGFASRSFTLACPVDDSKVDASYKDGILELKLPKKADTASRRIAIQ